MYCNHLKVLLAANLPRLTNKVKSNTKCPSCKLTPTATYNVCSFYSTSWPAMWTNETKTWKSGIASWSALVSTRSRLQSKCRESTKCVLRRRPKREKSVRKNKKSCKGKMWKSKRCWVWWRSQKKAWWKGNKLNLSTRVSRKGSSRYLSISGTQTIFWKTNLWCQSTTLTSHRLLASMRSDSCIKHWSSSSNRAKTRMKYGEIQCRCLITSGDRVFSTAIWNSWKTGPMRL